MLLIAADLLLAAATTLPLVLVGAACWGLHMGCSQGILASMVADQAPAELKGSAFGLFNLASGLCLLLASVLAGALWHYLGASASFIAGAVLAGLCLCLLLLQRRAQLA
ncbi:Major Facilitator Superfamily protein [compost metagenome]